MDIKMPGMNGIEATKEIKKNKPNIPIIAISAYVDRENIKRVLDAGSNTFIEKPIDRNILLRKIAELI